jgi:hypothetical protein
MCHGIVRDGNSQMGDPSMTIGDFAVPCSVERSMTSLREAGDDAEDTDPDSGESEMTTRPTSVRGESAAELGS